MKKALSIKQPWAWLIVNGYKPVENRSWTTKIRGEILIHAGKTFDLTALDFLMDVMPDVYEKVEEHFDLCGFQITQGEFGGIVGKVEIVDCVESYDSPWFFGPYGFVLRDAQPLPFVPCRGQLGFFEVKEVAK